MTEDESDHGGLDAVDRLDAEFEMLFRHMQTPQARRAMDEAFQASPKELGEAAVKQARKKSDSDLSDPPRA